MTIAQPSYPVATSNLVTHIGAYADSLLGGGPIVKLTQSAYDALGTKDPNTLYVIVG